MPQAVPSRHVHTAAREISPSLRSRLWAFKPSFSPLLWIPVALAVIWIAILTWKWPFTQSRVETALQKEIGKPLQIGSFRATFLPLGYVVEDVKFVDSKNGDTPIAVRKFTVIASYADLLFMRKSLQQVAINGLHMAVPLTPTASQQEKGSSHPTAPRFSSIGEIKMDDSVIEFSSTGTQEEPFQEEPFKVVIRSATLQNMNRHSSSPFRAELVINEPSGMIHATGRLGPWNWNDAGQTSLAGSFTFSQANLDTVGDMKGSFNAEGKFDGPLHRLSCYGHVEIPQFGTAQGRYTLPLSTIFHATVNGLNGDTVLNDVQSRLNRTVIRSQGEIKGKERQVGKTAHLHLIVDEGQVDDFLLLVTRSPQPSMTGAISLQADVDIPANNLGFLQKLKLQGDFGMSGSRFTKASTQSPINHLSKSAEGLSKDEEIQDPTIVLSDIKGHVSAQNGIASLSHLSFVIPGANANMAGTYNLLDKTVHLDGTLKTTGKLSDATSGWKAGFTKLLSPFLKKHSVTVVPFKITGTAQNSHFMLDLARKQRR